MIDQADSVDPDETAHESHQGLHCLPTFLPSFFIKHPLNGQMNLSTFKDS